MASFNYMNNTAPFWDFIASLEQQGSNHPFFGQNEIGLIAMAAVVAAVAVTALEEEEDAVLTVVLVVMALVDIMARPMVDLAAVLTAITAPHTRDILEVLTTNAVPIITVDQDDARDAASLFAPLWEAFTAQHASNQNNDTTKKDNEDFTPEADIFDTPSAYIIHISLPGAKKEDVGVNWDAEKSELSIAGVIYRPGDEEFLKTLAMNERKVGPFERKIRLGSRANPAHVDADGIIAKLEDGVLRVEVRKEDEGFVEIKKVDIE
ncbi:hypothetical protein E8E12_009284 [Didymella heteroderae]|uniref:SHSP domain-containing protein n=1 Tax=Didymella heteroderae TaxID=1769908 RepID=A0A9P5C225_9PLEO|nr:hypothetical protein E8E12_009284 [Didymella heteroderae]